MDMIIDRQSVGAIRKAVSDYDLTASPAWGDVAVLASNVLADGFELDEDSVTSAGEGPFQAIANVYLILEYGRGEEGFSTSESFRADIAGTVIGDQATIDSVKIDTSSFYD